MKTIKPVLKRVGAYLIDIFIIFFVSSLISSIPAINKNIDSYQKTYDEYEEKYNEYAEYILLFKELYEDDEINADEYNQLTESTIYQDLIISKYEDSIISQEEYQEIIQEINNQFDDVATEYVYLLNKQSTVNTIITLICTLLYFGILQYILKGKTIGKKLFKLQVVPATEKKLNIFNYIIRTLIVNEVLLNSISLIFLITASKTLYQNANTILATITSILEGIIIFLVLTREDHRGVHDLLCNTKVIELDNQDITSKDENVIPTEEKTTIKKNNNKSKSNKKTQSKNKVVDAEYKEKNNKDMK